MEMKTALLRIPAFIIDLVMVSGVIMLINKIAISAALVTGFMPVEALMLLALPLGFFVYWLTGLHLEKAIWLEGHRCEDRPASIRVSMFSSLLIVFVGGIPECLPLYSGACFPGAERVS